MTEELINIIVLKENGNIEEIQLDLDKNKNEIGLYLQDKLTFIGQINREDTENIEEKKTNIILINGFNAEKKGRKLNKCKLPEPFDKEKIFGDIILLPMNDKIEPENIYLKEYYELFNNENN